MAQTLETVEALAPDQSSLTAARKLLKHAIWPTRAAGEGLAWGECLGSGSTPYRVVISEADDGYKCTCPSRKFPCKHSLALMWMRAEGKIPFAPAPVPEWVKDWLSRRRGHNATSAKPADEDNSTRTAPSLRLIEDEVSEVVDPKAEARAAAARERNRLERETAILSGLDDLDLWLTDQIDRGIAAFVTRCHKECRALAQRLVDAKSGGLATRLEAIPTRLFTLPEPARPIAAVKELGQLHLIAAAYRRQAELPPTLVIDVRQATGWAITGEALLASESAQHVTGVWHVVAALSEVQPDRLRRVETWLWREQGTDEAPRFALLLDFIPVATGAASSSYTIGDQIEAELVFYPSAHPQRAQIVRTLGAQPSTNSLALTPQSLVRSYTAYQQSLAQLPWLGVYPLSFTGARIRRSGEALFLCDGDDALALPLHADQSTLALPLASLSTLNGIALWNGYTATLSWAETSLGPWVNA